MVGALALEGECHGRHVTITRQTDRPTVVTVRGSYPEFSSSRTAIACVPGAASRWLRL